MTAATELELVRSKGDRRLYELADVGTLRLEGIFGRSAIAEADSERWTLRRRLWTSGIDASDGTGATVGEFTTKLFGSGGKLHWRGREFTLRRASVWRERYALVEGERELVLFDVKPWGRRPVFVRVEPAAQVDSGLLLFAVFVVRVVAADDSVGATTAATSGTASSGAFAGGA
jgi:hypothetical protein